MIHLFQPWDELETACANNTWVNDSADDCGDNNEEAGCYFVEGIS